MGKGEIPARTVAAVAAGLMAMETAGAMAAVIEHFVLALHLIDPARAYFNSRPGFDTTLKAIGALGLKLRAEAGHG